MKVKIGDKIYDGEQEPVMVILSDADKKNIRNMSTECTKYASFPEGLNTEEIAQWMMVKSPHRLKVVVDPSDPSDPSDKNAKLPTTSKLSD